MNPDQHAEAARHDLDAGDVTSAAGHISAALAADPRSDGFIDLLRHLINAAGDDQAEALFRGLETPAGLACVGWVQAGHGQADAALATLVQAAKKAPASGFLEWLTTWARDEGWSPASATALLASIDELAGCEDALGQRQMRAVARAAERRAARLTITPPSLARAVAEAWLAANEPAKAAAWAGEAYEVDHGYRSALTYGQALAGAGRMESAERVFRVALNARPEDIEVRLAWAVAAVKSGDTATAATLFAEALERQPHHGRARAGCEYARWLSDGRASSWLSLHLTAGLQPHDALVQAWDGEATPWRTSLLLVEQAPFGSLTVAGEPRWSLYSGGQPALPMPPDPLVDLVLELADTAFVAAQWLVAGREIGLRAGPTATRDLLAVALYPMMADDKLMAQRAASMFAVLGTSNDWERSDRRAAFESVFATSDVPLRLAAIAALAELGQTSADAAVLADVTGWLVPLARQAPWPLRRAAVYGLARLSPDNARDLVESLDAAEPS